VKWYDSEFKRGRFKVDTTRRRAEDEAVIDVDDVPFRIYENIAVVTVLYLQEIANKRVASQGFYEVLLGLFERILECFFEECGQALEIGNLLLETIDRDSISDELEDPGVA
jgi:hypothetical protein